MSAETEGIAQGDIHLGLAGHIRHHIEIALRILIVHIDRGRNHTVLIAMIQAASSMPPAAPRRWPVMDFVELTTSPFFA